MGKVKIEFQENLLGIEPVFNDLENFCHPKMKNHRLSAWIQHSWKITIFKKTYFFVSELGHIYNLRNWNVRFKKTYFVRLLTKIRVRHWMSCCERFQIFVTKKQKRPHGWESILPSAIFSPLLFYARNLIHLWTKIILVTKILRRHFETTVIYHLEMNIEQPPLISKWQSYIISKRDRDFFSFRRDSHLLFRRDRHILSKG